MAKLIVAVRQLAERRGRLAAEVPRLEQLIADASARLAEARAELAAVDLILPTFDNRVDPTEIAPIKARAGRYGKRGAFKDELLRMLKEASPAPLSTNMLGLALRHRFSIAFANKEHSRAWVENVLRPQLRRLVQEGVLERVRLTDNQADDVFWRVAQPRAESLDALRVESANA
jgi:hypothetical protein